MSKKKSALIAGGAARVNLSFSHHHPGLLWRRVVALDWQAVDMRTVLLFLHNYDRDIISADSFAKRADVTTQAIDMMGPADPAPPHEQRSVVERYWHR
jgi:hypothetical protein